MFFGLDWDRTPFFDNKAAFQRGITVADMLRDLLAREFPDIGGDRP